MIGSPRPATETNSVDMMSNGAGEGAARDGKTVADGQMRIGDLARDFGVTLRALRFYEDKGLLNPKREGTTRLYSRQDRGRLKIILLGRRLGFSLRDVKQIIDLYEPKGSNAKQLRLALEKSEKQLLRLKKQRDTLDEAIEELGRNMSIYRDLLSGQKPAGSQN